MANDDLNNTHERRTLRPIEINALADRMLSRALSALFDASRQPHLKSDMLLASALLRVLATSYPDGVEVWVWRGTE